MERGGGVLFIPSVSIPSLSVSDEDGGWSGTEEKGKMGQSSVVIVIVIV